MKDREIHKTKEANNEDQKKTQRPTKSRPVRKTTHNNSPTWGHSPPADQSSGTSLVGRRRCYPPPRRGRPEGYPTPHRPAPRGCAVGAARGGYHVRIT